MIKFNERRCSVNKFYITTAIDYPVSQNGYPHIGTSFEKLGADIQARYQRFCGNDVYFLMGNDENTAKVVKVTKDTKAYVDDMAAKFKKTWKALNISYDDFIQTTEERHKIGVQKFLQQVYDAGYVYKKPYKGIYCEGCEEFKTSKTLVDGQCPNHPNAKVYELEEENYWFKLSKFQFRLQYFLGRNIEVLPEYALNGIQSFIESDLEDISISRTNRGWGIPCPFDETQVVYVWFDALLNYLTGVGFGTDEEKFKKWWPANVHIIGKDIVRFHCALWPAMILAYNENTKTKINFPEKVFAHGFIYQKKDDVLIKESKSGQSVNPIELIETYGTDAYRYYFMAKCPFYKDGEYNKDHFKEVYHSDLVNNLGNLVSRVCNLANGKFHKCAFNWNFDLKNWTECTENYSYREALASVWELLSKTNEYIEREKPWKAADNRPILHNAMTCLRLVSVLLKPYLPETSEKIYKSFGFKIPWDKIDINYLTKIVEDNCYDLDDTTDLLISGRYPHLFPRIK